MLITLIGHQRRSLKNARRSSISNAGSSMAAKCPPSACSFQYAIWCAGSMKRRMIGSVLNTTHPLGTPEGTTQSRLECSASHKKRAALAPLRVNQ